MARDPKAEKELEHKLHGIMTYFVKTYFDYYSYRIKDIAAKHNVTIENDMLELQIDSYINKIAAESSEKFKNIGMLILDSIVAGREVKVREFEVLFVDLVKRTLVEDMKEDKRRVTPVIIVSDSGVEAKET